MIKPTVGRVVWFCPDPDDTTADPLAAIIARVWTDGMVNLCVIDRDGVTHSRTSVMLWHGEGPRPTIPFCEWMPYQKGQAARTEQLETQLADGISYRESIDNGDKHQGNLETGR